MEGVLRKLDGLLVVVFSCRLLFHGATHITTTTTADKKVLGDGLGMSRQQKGGRKARRQEMVRQAARRGVAFGSEIDGHGNRKRRVVEAVQGGKVVENRFAKGGWGFTWRE